MRTESEEKTNQHIKRQTYTISYGKNNHEAEGYEKLFFRNCNGSGDGLKEATNQDMELFGMERIKASLQTVADGDQADAATYIHHLEDDVADFVKEAPQADDLTLLAIKVLNP